MHDLAPGGHAGV